MTFEPEQKSISSERNETCPEVRPRTLNAGCYCELRCLDSCKFYGRQEELKQLEQIYRDFCQQSLRQEVCMQSLISEKLSSTSGTQLGDSSLAPIVLISGYSGCGKSALVEQFAKRIKSIDRQSKAESKSCYFLSGKYDYGQNADPLSAISSAFRQYVNELVVGDIGESDRIRRSLLTAAGDEVEVLTDVLPSLEMLIGKQPSQATSHPNKVCEGNRLRYAFRRLAKAICDDDRPVVLFLDDLQWADEASLDLLMDLVTDTLLKNFMVIATFRSNEVDDRHPLMGRIRRMRRMRRCYQIKVDNLSEEAVGMFLADLLRLEVEETSHLSKAIYKKTQGNIFFTKQLLEDLRLKGILSYSLITYKWTWDITKVDASSLSDNVIDLVTANISKLPPKLRRALAIAAYIRSWLVVDILLGLMQVEEDPVECVHELRCMLDLAVSQGCLQREGSNYKFSHDRIKEAFHQLIPVGDERDAMHLRIGRYLMEKANDSLLGEDWMLFIAADHLNSISQTDLPPLDLANLNLQVGEKAIQVAAFVPASGYLRHGLEALQRIESPWQKNYDIALRLYRAAADVELCLGDFDRGNHLCQVIKNNTASIKDKLLVSLSLAGALGRHQKHAESMQVHLEALYLVGEFPKRFHIACLLRKLRKVNRCLQKFSDQEILDLPIMKDETRLIAMEHLTNLLVRSVYCNNKTIGIICTLLQLVNTFEHGLCPQSADAFAAYGGILFGHFGDQRGANRLSQLACKTLDRVKAVDKRGAKTKECHVLYIVSAYINAFTSSPSRVLATLQRSYKSGLETGDVEKALRSWVGASYYAFLVGFPLDLIETSSSKLLGQLQRYGAAGLYSIFSTFGSTIAHLTGNSEVPLDWEIELSSKFMMGKAMNKLDPSQTHAASRFYWGRIQLAYYFREIEIAGKMIEPLRAFSKIDATFVYTSIQVYFSGLVSVGLSRRTGNRRHLKVAKMMMREMKAIVKNNGINNLHRYLLMKAEITACVSKDMKKVKSCYDAAISAASRVGFRQDAALGNELAAEYMLNSNDELWPSHYFTASHALYRDWGASAKAEQLLRSRGSYIQLVRIPSSSTFETKSLASGDENSIHFRVNLEMLSGKKTLNELFEIEKFEEIGS